MTILTVILPKSKVWISETTQTPPREPRVLDYSSVLAWFQVTFLGATVILKSLRRCEPIVANLL